MNSIKRLWDSWLEIEQQDIVRQSASELHSKGVDAYYKCQYLLSADLFHEAGMKKLRNKDIPGYCNELYLEGRSLYLNGDLEKALNCLLYAEQLNEVTQFNNLERIVSIAILIPSPISEIYSMIDQLSVFKKDYKSWILSITGQLLYYQGKYAEFLYDVQEAFANRKSSGSELNDLVYYSLLVDALRLNCQYIDAWKWLHEWRNKGSRKFSDIKSLQFFEEGKLLYDENKYLKSWEVLCKSNAEDKFLGHAGKSADKQVWLIKTGVKLGYHEVLKEQVLILFSHRNSSNGHDRYNCRKGIAIFYCSLLRKLCECENSHIVQSKFHTKDINSNQHSEWNINTVRKRALNWLNRAELCAQELDNLLECTWRQEEVTKLRKTIVGL